MYAKTILFPTDFSTSSDAAIDHAAALANESGATLLVVHVEEPLPAYIGEGYYGRPNPPNPEVRRMLMGVRPKNEATTCEYRLLQGDPVEEIVRLAEEEPVDLIVMGTHGRTGLGRLLMGSVAEAVVSQASVPVLTIKQPRHEAAAAT